MSKFEVSYTDSAIVFVNSKTNKAEKLEMGDVMAPIDAINAIRKEQNAAVSASRGAVSLLCELLTAPRLDGYKGTCPLNEAMPKELKSAVRELEVEYIKPIFCAPHIEKGAKAHTVEKLWQEYYSELNAGGSYAVAKGHVLRLFSYTGALPKHGDKVLTVAAIKKLLENLEKPDQEKSGIAGKLVSLSTDIENRNEKTDLGDYVTAIAALKSMLATYTGLQAEALEALTSNIGNTAHNVPQVAMAAIAKANSVNEPAMM